MPISRRATICSSFVCVVRLSGASVSLCCSCLVPGKILADPCRVAKAACRGLEGANIGFRCEQGPCTSLRAAGRTPCAFQPPEGRLPAFKARIKIILLMSKLMHSCIQYYRTGSLQQNMRLRTNYYAYETRSLSLFCQLKYNLTTWIV